MEQALPKKLVAFGHSFRVEVGKSGAQSRGLYRVHQFSKVEMVAVTTDDVSTSNTMLEELRSHQQDIFADLGLHFKV